MAYEMKPNTGSLFRNDKATKPTDPTHTGQADIGGVAMWVSAWVNEAKDGRKYFALKFTAKDQAGSYAPKAKPAAQPDFEDEIPF